MKLNLRKLRWILIGYVLVDFLLGYAGIIPIQNAAAAQFTQVSGTVLDPSGIPYALGTISARLVLPGGTSATLNGLPYSPPTQPSGLDLTGSFTMQLADNTVLLPGATQWTFVVCSAIGTVLPSGGKGPVCFNVGPLTISGSSQSISAQLQAAALPLTSSIPASNCTAVGQCYLLLPNLADITQSAGTTASGGAGGTVRCALLQIDRAITFTKITINVTAAVNTNKIYLGIYNAAGTSLLVQGTITMTAATGLYVAVVPATTLRPGAYWWAFSTDNVAVTMTGNNTWNLTDLGVINNNNVAWGFATNTLSGGVLPATLGVITPNNAVLPIAKLEP
jgi:hypothetical protein